MQHCGDPPRDDLVEQLEPALLHRAVIQRVDAFGTLGTRGGERSQIREERTNLVRKSTRVTSMRVDGVAKRARHGRRRESVGTRDRRQ